ncbi:MAG: hypothetical protein AB7R89_07890 [Dehalococcoidia bacterium]
MPRIDGVERSCRGLASREKAADHRPTPHHTELSVERLNLTGQYYVYPPREDRQTSSMERI